MNVTKPVTMPAQLMDRLEALAVAEGTEVDYIIAEAVSHFLLEVDQQKSVPGPTTVTAPPP